MAPYKGVVQSRFAMKAGLFILLVSVAASSGAAGDESLRDLCPDRPGKDTSACTVDADHIQLESDIVDGAFQHSGGVTTDVWFIADSLVKYGVTDGLDAEVGFAPLVVVRTHDSRTGATQVLGGIGDTVLRAKWAAIGNSGSDFALALDPFLKLPTARSGIGNGAVEGGVAMPVGLTLSDGWSLGTTPEVDLLKDNGDDDHHANVVDVISVNRSLGSNVTLGVEVWEDTDFDPRSTTEAWSFDLVAAWLSDPNTQFDAGVNLGLNRNTPGLQAYCGYSRRF